MDTFIKLLLYFVKKLTALVIIVTLVVLAAFIAYDCANIFIILNEGMVHRASVILQKEEPADLQKFFTSSYLSADPALSSNVYEGYAIQDYDLQIKIKWLWAWPWNDYARATIEEVIPRIEVASSQEDGEVATPHPWNNGEKLVMLKKNKGRWKIDRIIFKSPIILEKVDER